MIQTPPRTETMTMKSKVTFGLATALAALAIGSAADATVAPAAPATLAAEGFVIVRIQAQYRDANGRLVLITDGIPLRMGLSSSEYGKMIGEGVRARSPGAGAVSYRTDAAGNVVSHEIAVTDLHWTQTTWTPAPKKQ